MLYTLKMLTYLLTYLLTYSMVQSPSWEANWFAASREIPRISWNPKVHYRTHKRPPPVPILVQPNPVHIPTFHLLEIHPNIIHPSTPRSPQWSLSLRSLKMLCYWMDFHFVFIIPVIIIIIIIIIIINIFNHIFSLCGAASQRGPWPPHSWGF